MTEPVGYRRDGRVATITIDDGKVNAFSAVLLQGLHAALDRAEADGSVVILTGRDGYFSAGFDLRVINGPVGPRVELLRLGATAAARLLAFPTPVVAACSGHAYPAGAFLLLAADRRVGVAGPYRIGLNEVRIGLTVPWFAVELARYRLHPAQFDRTTVTGALYSPAAAADAGFLDRVVAAGGLETAARAEADELAALDPTAHAATKLRARAEVLRRVREAIDTELTVDSLAQPMRLS